MAHKTAVILVVGLDNSILVQAPRLKAFSGRNAVARLKPTLPAVTCSVQSSMLTGLKPSQHGIVGNGWYDRELSEIQFWKQSNHLVYGEKVWETARRRDPSVTCAKLFWWYNMYSSADYSLTPRPIYKADGRKLPDVYSHPADLRTRAQEALGTFPLFHFWGPGSSIKSSQWIAEASKLVHQWHTPTLSLVYLPHLDYALQHYGPGAPESWQAVSEIDRVAGELIDYYEGNGVHVIVCSEYGIESVNKPVHINRALREHGMLRVRDELGGELLDPGASDAFAVADHQLAHVYVNRPELLDKASDICRSLPGVEQVLGQAQQREAGIAHNRSGDLVCVAKSGSWFTYYYWLDDRAAPDFARTVEIHRKPGYDPCELIQDPSLSLPKLRIAAKVLGKKLGFRMLMDVIPLNAELVRGSHGRLDPLHEHSPLLIASEQTLAGREEMDCRDVKDVVLSQLFA